MWEVRQNGEIIGCGELNFLLCLAQINGGTIVAKRIKKSLTLYRPNPLSLISPDLCIPLSSSSKARRDGKTVYRPDGEDGKEDGAKC